MNQNEKKFVKRLLEEQEQMMDFIKDACVYIFLSKEAGAAAFSYCETEIENSEYGFLSFASLQKTMKDREDNIKAWKEKQSKEAAEKSS
jgi:hypothetical protein